MDTQRSSVRRLSALPKNFAFNPRMVWFSYGVAIGSLVVTALIRVLLDNVLEDKNQFILYLPAVLLSTWFGGFGPGVLVFVLGCMAGVFLNISPAFSFIPFNTAHSVGLVLYVIVGGLMVSLTKVQGRTQYRAGVKQRQLESEVMDGKRRDDQHTQLLLVEQNARIKAEKDNALKSQFVAMVAHELRTPLTSIKGFASSLLDRDVTWNETDQNQFFQIIDEEADKLNELVDQLLDLTQLQAGNLRIHVQEYSLLEIISLAKNDLETLAAKHNLILNIPENLPRILADPKRLAQVLLNLVGNAAKYSPQNTSITVSAKNHSDEIQVDVADEGFGIPMQHRKAIFEVFRQLDDVTGHFMKGSGLGLAICKGLVETHGGRIWVGEQSTPGTVVSFTLPIYQDSLVTFSV